ncbi:glucose-6-phosphate dehydrogenase assembly protein OpcA [Paramicrobacterium agarici]|uniref:Glucose-6-phosphate dehydrogenase assembly protein OpcA n=1 Tax=Paramicrobacterium agarici TaxID=630514 RepID=A0A2A9DZM5_9MICO|nr:glucose-6-phosphate dehydrogenase assembly protein OpcA [Microbacterium agarici]PFG31370.1 glucose-6-phosphate dehydrogenase assembly protein OpcA [Microbacterium agarici]TQO21256.1 glucose-6-phosphate dehydrogenase assembly protein OpcA [Microbacterium agarici]
MIIDIPDTTTSAISKRLVLLRDEGGVIALGRVLTLVIIANRGDEEDAIEAANDASREHPMRVIVISVAGSQDDDDTRIDAQIRVGGDAGASEVIILRAYGEATQNKVSLVTALLLPDAPVVAWWPGETPDDVSASPIGQIAQRRITDASAHADPHDALRHLAASHRPGDTDFAWTRLTLWRAQLAAVLDQPPYEQITSVRVTGAADSPSTTLLAAWLRLQLNVPVTCDLTHNVGGVGGIHGVEMTRASGTISLERPLSNIATLEIPGQPVQDIALPRRTLRDCLAEELRRLDPDVLYGDVITKGLALLDGEGAEPTEGVQ